MKLGPVRHDTRCAVCWGTMKKVKVVSPCLHRFCSKCIEEHLRKLCVAAESRAILPSIVPPARIPPPSAPALPCPPFAPPPLLSARRNHYCPTCRAHVPSRRALRDDPDFDAVVTTLYASAQDYDLRENAYSAFVAKKSMEEDKEQREREREAKKRRMEEAAKQAALMREQYRAQAEAEAKAKAEAKAEREAAEAAAKEARDKQRAEAARAAEIAARQAAQLAEAAAAKQSAAKAAKRDATEPPSKAAAAAAAAAPPAKRGRPSKAAAAAAAAAASASSSKPASFSLPAALAAPNANLMQMPDDFAGLYAVRASDDATRLAASAKEKGAAAAKDPGSYASMQMRVELRRNASDGGAGLLSAPHVMVSGSAPVGVLKQLVATQVGGQVTREAVRVTAEDGGPGEAADLGADVAVADALFEQIAAGEKNLSLRYSVV